MIMGGSWFESLKEKGGEWQKMHIKWYNTCWLTKLI